MTEYAETEIVWSCLRSVVRSIRNSRALKTCAIISFFGLFYHAIVLHHTLNGTVLKPADAFDWIAFGVWWIIVINQIVLLTFVVVAGILRPVVYFVLSVSSLALVICGLLWVGYDCYYLLRYADLSVQIVDAFNEGWLRDSSSWRGLKFVIQYVGLIPLSLTCLFIWWNFGPTLNVKADDFYREWLQKTMKENERDERVTPGR